MINNKKIRKLFPFFKNNPKEIYFDSSATSLKPQCVIDEITDYYTKYNTNPHNIDSELSYKTYKKLKNIRYQIAKFINAPCQKEIIFTSGTTFSINQIAFGISHLLLPEDIILITKQEHSSNILPWYRLAKINKIQIKFIPLNNFKINIIELKKMINSKVKIISFADISNTFGEIQNVDLIVKIIRKINPKIIIIIDCAQSIICRKIDVQKWDVDFIVFSGHKMFGPTGIGILWGKTKLLTKLEPLLLGGNMNSKIFNDGINYTLKNIPNMLEAGSLNIAGIFGLGKAIDFINKITIKQICEYTQNLKKYAVKMLKTKLKNKIIIYNENTMSSILLFNIKNFFAQDVSMHLGSIHHITVRSGEHCAKLIGDLIENKMTIRISFSIYNNKFEINKLIDSLIKEKYFLGKII